MIEIVRDRSHTGRFFLSALPAMGLTLGLFLIMQKLVHTEELALPDGKPFPTLVKITPVEPGVEAPTYRPPVTAIETAAPPKVKTTELVTSEGISFAPIEIAEPSFRISADQLKQFSTGQVGGIREEAVPVRAPSPDYPPIALRQGLQGECEVRFSIDAAGRPFNVDGKCTDPVFVSSSERAVKKALFAAKVKNGVAVGQDNLVYPIVYNMSEN